MTVTPWAPLSRRSVGLGQDDTLYDGVPPHLRGALDDWIEGCFDDVVGPGLDLGDGVAQAWEHELCLRLRINRVRPPSRHHEDLLLDVVDAMLRWRPARSVVNWNDLSSRLDKLLTLGGSSWRVNASKDGLDRRIDATITAAVTATIHTASVDAAEHLSAAWAAAYGRNPDPDKAYDEAVLAVEAVICPLVCPTNPRRTLGTVIADLDNQSARWALAIGDVAGQPAGPVRLIEMLKLLWQGQSRHAGSPNSRHQTQTESEAVVHLAATLVQWLTSGVLYLR